MKPVQPFVLIIYAAGKRTQPGAEQMLFEGVQKMASALFEKAVVTTASPAAGERIRPKARP